MTKISKQAKLIVKNKQINNLSIFVPKKTKLVKSTNDNPKKPYQKVKTGLTFQQLRNIKKYKKCYFTKEFSHVQQEKAKAKRSKIINISSFVLNIVILAIVLIVSLTQQSNKAEVFLPPIDWNWMGILIGLVVALFAVETLKYVVLIKTSTKKFRPSLGYKVMALGKYYDAVTPMSTGGQPFQMLYLNKRGIKGDVATSIPLVRYMFWQIAYVIICSVILIYNNFCPVQGGSQLFSVVIAWIAVLINVIIVSTVLFLSISKKVGPLIVIWFLKLGSKLKIIKNYRVTFRKVMRFVVNYQKTMKMFAKNIWVFLTEIVLAAIEIIVYNILVYFIYKAFVPTGTMSIIDIGILSLICSLSVGFIPTPGAAGGAEAFFSIIFGSAFGGNLFWPLLIWRMATYYIYLIQGLLVLVYDFLIGNKKYERQRLKELGLQPTEPTFRTILAENKQNIKILQNQEEDKLLIPTFLSSKLPEKHVDEIIADGDIVTPDEMKKEVQEAEQVLTYIRIQDIKKRKEKREKQQIKAQLKQNKKNKDSK